MSKWILCIQPNYTHYKPTHLTPLSMGLQVANGGIDEPQLLSL